MSNNTPDYDNLAFDPSALNPCNDGKRGSDVLMTTLEKCQAIVAKNVELEKKLKIAIEALKEYADKECWEDTYIGDKGTTQDYVWLKKGGLCSYGYLTAMNALEKIKE